MLILIFRIFQIINGKNIDRDFDPRVCDGYINILYNEIAFSQTVFNLDYKFGNGDPWKFENLTFGQNLLTGYFITKASGNCCWMLYARYEVDFRSKLKTPK